MSKTVRCKMNINAVRDVGSCIRLEMGAVYSSRPDNENKSFSDATPCAYFQMDISKNTEASHAEFLHPGAEVYVDISLASIPEWNWSDRYPEVGRKVEMKLKDLTTESIFGEFRLEPQDLNKPLYKTPQLLKEDGSILWLRQSSGYAIQYYWKYSQ